MKQDWSQRIYVHLHIKKRAVSGVGGVRGKVSRWQKEKDFGNSEKPCILTLQGNHRGRLDGRGRGQKGRGGRGKAGRSPLLGGLGGPWWGDRPTRIYTAVLVLGLLLWGLQDLQWIKHNRQKRVICCFNQRQHSACVSVFSPLPGMSTWGIRPRSSCRLRCRTPRSSWERRRVWPVGVWQRTRIHPPQPASNTKKKGRKTRAFVTLLCRLQQSIPRNRSWIAFSSYICIRAAHPAAGWNSKWSKRKSQRTDLQQGLY